MKTVPSTNLASSRSHRNDLLELSLLTGQSWRESKWKTSILVRQAVVAALLFIIVLARFDGDIDHISTEYIRRSLLIKSLQTVSPGTGEYLPYNSYAVL